jgi:hypothetical protein
MHYKPQSGITAAVLLIPGLKKLSALFKDYGGIEGCQTVGQGAGGCQDRTAFRYGSLPSGILKPSFSVTGERKNWQVFFKPSHGGQSGNGSLEALLTQSLEALKPVWSLSSSHTFAEIGWSKDSCSR